MSTTQFSNSDEPANRFKDRSGKEWVIELDRSKMFAIRRDLDIDLGTPERISQPWAVLCGDDDKLEQVVWAALADRRGEITFEEFQSRNDGATLAAARDALREAIFFFTQPALRQVARTAIAAMEDAWKQAIREAETAAAKAIQDAAARGLGQLGRKWTRSRESSVTSTRRGRSGKRK